MAVAWFRNPVLDYTAPLIDRDSVNERTFGVTETRRHPAYVYSINKNSCLMHKVASVTIHWYALVGPRGSQLGRLKQPAMIAHTVCGCDRSLTPQRTRTCHVPLPDSILCGRCHGEPATFGKHGKGTQAGLKRAEAHVKLGCIVAGYPSALAGRDRRRVALMSVPANYQHDEHCTRDCACGLGKGPTIEEVSGCISFAPKAADVLSPPEREPLYWCWECDVLLTLPETHSHSWQRHAISAVPPKLAALASRPSPALPEQETWEAAKLKAYRQARIWEPNMDCYHAAMSVYAAAFGKPDGEPSVLLPDGTTKQPWEFASNPAASPVPDLSALQGQIATWNEDAKRRRVLADANPSNAKLAEHMYTTASVLEQCAAEIEGRLDTLLAALQTEK